MERSESWIADSRSGSGASEPGVVTSWPGSVARHTARQTTSSKRRFKDMAGSLVLLSYAHHLDGATCASLTAFISPRKIRILKAFATRRRREHVALGHKEHDMADLRASYMGIDLKNPLIAGASSLTSNMGSIKKLEDEGAAAMVISSLFEETIQLQSYKMEQDMSYFDNLDAEIQNIFPDIEHAGPEEHLMWVRKAKEAVQIPVIASLNCTNPQSWVDWAKKLEETGVDGLELNFFAIPTDFDETSESVEKYQVDTLTAIIKAVKIPVSVKLSPFYTSPLNVVKRMDATGVAGFVIFNRLWHPEVDADKESMDFPFHLSDESDRGLPLRYVGMLSGAVKGSLCASNGVHQGSDAVEMILGGADVFQTVSTLYLNGVKHVGKILKDIETWMDRRGYEKLADFRGKLNYASSKDKWTFKRAQYVTHLLNSEKYVKRSSAL
jgi:dihydroorotate dehydrogenase (fumarate)